LGLCLAALSFPTAAAPAGVAPDVATPTPTGTPTVALPDLQVSALANPPALVVAGASFTVTDTTTNFGTAPAVPSTTGYVLSLDRTLSREDTAVGARAVPGLAPGTSSTGAVPATVPTSQAPGAYFLIACADAQRVVTEGDESNNCRASATTVQVLA